MIGTANFFKGEDMVRKKVVPGFLIVFAAFITAGCTINQNTASPSNNAQYTTQDIQVEVELLVNNPIDKAFANDFAIASAAAEMRYLANLYYDAWVDEWHHVLDTLKQSYQYDEDKGIVDQYKTQYDLFVETAGELEFLEWTDTSVEPDEERGFGTGAISASTLKEADLYRRQVIHLIVRYFPDGEYSFIYNGKGAEIEKLRSE